MMLGKRNIFWVSNKRYVFMPLKRFFIIGICFVLFITEVCLCHSISVIDQKPDSITYDSEQHSLKIEELNQESENMKDSISTLYEINSSHENCVALVMKLL